MINTNKSLSKAVKNAARCLAEARNPRHVTLKEIKTLTFGTGEKSIIILLPNMAVSWCIENHLPTWSQSSWNVYRSGYRQLLSLALKNKVITPSECDRSIKEIDDAKASLQRKQSKSKQTFPATDLTKILERANELTISSSDVVIKKYKWGAALVCWLQASIITGLSPEEWKTANVKRFDDGRRMTVRYKKSKAGVKKPPRQYQVLYLSELDHNAMDNIENLIRLIKAYEEAGSWDLLYRRCACLIGRINKKIWPRRTINITLNTAYQKFSREFIYHDISDEINKLVRTIKVH